MSEMTPGERTKALEALGDRAKDVSPEFSFKETEHKEETSHAVKVDVWGKRKAEKIIGDWDLDDDSESMIADAHTACFDPQPVLEENCNDQVKKRWFKEVLESPDYQQLHSATCFDSDLSQIASVRLYRQYQEYLANLTSDEQEEIENTKQEDNDEGYDNDEGWGVRVDRSSSVQKGIQKAGQDIKDAQEAADALGCGSGDGSPSELGTGVLDAFKKLRDNPRLRAISEATGRFLDFCKSLQTKKTIHGMDDLVGVTLGDEINRLIPSELMKLTDEDMENELLLKIHERTAMVRDYRSLKKIGRGPIMVLVDESGSMTGDPIIAAKGLALSLAWLARHQNRWCCLVGWSSEGSTHRLVLDPSTPNSKLMDWALKRIGGGTHPPVEMIPELFDKTKAPEGKTDIIWITDGECDIEKPVVEKFQDWRKDHKCKIWTIGIGCEAESFKPFSDRTVKVSQLSTSEPVIEEILSI